MHPRCKADEVLLKNFVPTTILKEPFASQNMHSLRPNPEAELLGIL